MKTLNKLIVAGLCILLINKIYPASPLWTFTPLTATTLTVPSTDTASVSYQITNQSRKTHSLTLRTVPGVSQNTAPGYCPNPFVLDYQQSCILTLIITGSQINGSIRGGPAVCQLGSDLQCYQPSAVNSLNVTTGAAEYTVGGTVFGLQGTVILENNGGDALTLTADGPFSFPTALPSGSPYLVTVQTQPATQTCTVNNGSGVIVNANVSNITVTCSTNARTVGGTVSGLSGTVVLQNNGADNLVINANGPFTFSMPVAQGATYNVTVFTQPATQTCSVINGSGTAGASNITNVQVTCADNAFTVGGTLSGLSGNVVLQNNGGDNLSLSSDGPFTFSTPVVQGAPYNVTVLTQPSGQTCSVANGSGTMGGANVTNVAVTCLDNTTLIASVIDLALSVNNPGVNPALTGTPRLITITNSGSVTAQNLTVVPPTWPAGTSSITTCTSTLTPGGSCTITITPGNTATSNGSVPCTNGSAPVPGVVQVTASNATAVSTNVVVLSYGCVSQGGFIFAVDDSPPNTASIGGKVAASTDEPGSYQWATLFDDTAADSNTDGAANTSALATPVGQYPAAQVCINKLSSGFSDWYLPAICELGYASGPTPFSGCGTQGAPLLQNTYSNLQLNGVGGFSGGYWGSTEYFGFPTNNAWVENFANGNQQITNKVGAAGVLVRCVRIF